MISDVLAWAVQEIRPFYTLDPHEGGTDTPPPQVLRSYA